MSLPRVLGPLLFPLVLLGGCTFGEGVRTAHDIAKAGCAILQAGNGNAEDVKDAAAMMLRVTVEQQARAAAQDERQRAAVKALEEVAAVNLAAARKASDEIARLAGERAQLVVLPPCPAAATPAPQSAVVSP